MLSPRELAEAVGVSESSLKRWADRGRVHVHRTEGGHRRIPVLGKGFSVTTTLAFVSRRIDPICSGSRRSTMLQPCRRKVRSRGTRWQSFCGKGVPMT